MDMYVTGDLQLQKIYVNTVILQLAGIQMMNLFLNHVYQNEEMVWRQTQIDGMDQKDVMIMMQLMKADQVIVLML